MKQQELVAVIRDVVKSENHLLKEEIFSRMIGMETRMTGDFDNKLNVMGKSLKDEICGEIYSEMSKFHVEVISEFGSLEKKIDRIDAKVSVHELQLNPK